MLESFICKFGKKIKIEDYSRQYLYGNTIEIYDWDGKQQKKVIKLDHIGQRGRRPRV